MKEIAYYAGSESEVKLDTQLRDTVREHGSKAEMALFVQNQEILSLLRRQRDGVPYCPKIKGYPVPDGYMGWDESEHKFRLFATENDYREAME